MIICSLGQCFAPRFRLKPFAARPRAMADRKRAELAAAVDEIVEAVTEVGFAGVMEGPSPLKTMVELHKLNDSTNLSKLLSALDETATRTMSARNVSFPELVVASQLLLDIEGPAAAPEDSPLESEVRAPAVLRLLTCRNHQTDNAEEARAVRGERKALCVRAGLEGPRPECYQQQSPRSTVA